MDLDDLDAKLAVAQRFASLAADELARCHAKAKQHGLIIPAYHVVWSTRGTTAGYCAYPCAAHSDYELRFNAHIAAHEGEGFRNTVAHELAHAITFHQHRRRVRPHGMEWELVMWTLGHKPTRCHSYTSARPAASKSLF